jgi:hypothetical protein
VELTVFFFNRPLSLNDDSAPRRRKRFLFAASIVSVNLGRELARNAVSAISTKHKSESLQSQSNRRNSKLEHRER